MKFLKVITTMFNRNIISFNSRDSPQGVCLLIYILTSLLAVAEFHIAAGKTGQEFSARRADDLKTCDSGTCIPLRECKPFLQLLRTRDSKNRREIWRKSCGFQNNRLLVCCPANNDEYLPKKCGNSRTVNRIHGGMLADLGEFPWMVALGYQGTFSQKERFICGASLINARYVLTAAHCLHKNDTKSNILTVIRVGDYNLSSQTDCSEGRPNVCFPDPIDAKPEKILIHPLYNISALHAADIALIRLDRTINLEAPEGKIEPVCLPEYGFNLRYEAQDREGVAVGWGSTEKGHHSDALLKVNLPFVGDRACKRKYKNIISEFQICVGGEKGKDACQGDSGGPLLLPTPYGTPYTQVGIVSFGVGCGKEGYPGVYTSVSDYIDWIRNSMEPW